MVTKEVIDEIYKRYKSRPSSPDELDIPLLFEHAIDNHGIYIDEGNLVIDNAGEGSPFHTIPLDRIHAIIEFDRVIAVVLKNAIIFLSKTSDKIHVHIKTPKRSFMDRIRDALGTSEPHPEF